VAEGRRGWAAWLFPRTYLDTHPVLGGLRVVLLVGSAAAVGAVLCPPGPLVVGVAQLAGGAFCCLAFSDRPGVRGQGWQLLIRRRFHRRLRESAPARWRWGVVCTAVSLVSLALGGGVVLCR
jgi:hypothetical protein